MKRWMAVASLCCVGLWGCVSPPQGVTPVAPFDTERYLGTWYEIARLDHSFERGLSRVEATYQRAPDGSIRVINRGFDAEKGSWREAIGRALPVGDPTVGHLKVSFFGPFYGAYVVARLDPEYQVSLVTGPNRDYLWLLARTRTIPAAVYEDYLSTAQRLGYDTQALIRVDQEPRP